MNARGLLLLVGVSGCVSGGREPNLALFHAVTDDRIVTPNVRLDPASWVRFRLTGRGCAKGCPTRWVPANALEAGSSGLTVRLPLDGELVKITVTRVTPDRLRLLSQLKVAGVTASDLNDGIELTGPGLGDWLQAARELGHIPGIERWVLGLNGIDVEVPGAVLPTVWTEHFLWGEVESVDVVGSKAFINHPNEPVSLPLGGHEGVASEDSQPLFTPAAVRRAWVRPQIAAEAGTSVLQGFADTQVSIELGVRLFNLFELGGGVRALWPELSGPTAFTTDGPLTPQRPRVVPEPLGTVRTGFAIDLDDDRRWTLQGGLELAFAPGTLRERIIAGVRARLWKGTFVALRAFTPEHSGAGWTVTSSAQVGAVF
jgi:hypothetical protein